MSIREWLAEKLCPSVFKEQRAYNRMKVEAADAYWWLNGYPDAADDGYSEAVQQIDQLTGGDGEYRYCTDHDPDRHTPGPAEMIQRIVDRFETLNLLDDATKTGRDQEWGISGTSGDDEAPVAWRYRHKEWSEDFWNYFTKEPRYKEDDEIWQGLYARPQSAAVRDVWKPIETAPKDGSRILISHQYGLKIAWWGAAAYNRKTKSYDSGWTDGGNYGFVATHWMPLPPAPALHSTQEG